MSSTPPLAGRHAIVTGAGGTGRQHAMLLARLGADAVGDGLRAVRRRRQDHLTEVGERRLAGGQNDMIVDIAFDVVAFQSS